MVQKNKPMNKTLQIKKLQDWFKSNCGIEPDAVDWTAEVDASLTYSENKQNLIKLIGVSPPVNLPEAEKKAEVEELASVVEYAEKEFSENIERIVKEANPKIKKYYQMLDDYVEMVAGGFSNSLIVYGSFGVGKSHRIMQKLGTSGVEFEHFSGSITPLGLYHLLYKHNGKVLFLDDVGSSIFENPKAVEILKPALQEVAGKRFLNYQTTSERLRVPERFEYTGSIIIATNELPDNTLSLRALLSRPLLLELDFSHKELLELFFIIAKQKYKTTTAKERMAVVKYLKENMTPACNNISLRTLFKGFDMVSYSEKRWRLLFSQILSFDERLQWILDHSDLAKQEQIELFKEDFGLSRRTYFRCLKKLNKRRGTAK